MALNRFLVRFEGAQQQEARMIKLSLTFRSLHLFLQIDPETLVLLLILARLVQRLA